MRAEAAAGHFIGTHSWSHPDNLRRLTPAAAQREITRGFQAVQDSLAGAPAADRAQLAPFFRFPGLNDSRTLRAWLGQQQIAVIGADFGTDDWKGIGAAEIERRAIRNAGEARGGVLIVHDTRPHTAEALSSLITALEERGYRFVQLAPAPGPAQLSAAPPPLAPVHTQVRVDNLQSRIGAWRVQLVLIADRLGGQWSRVWNN